MSEQTVSIVLVEDDPPTRERLSRALAGEPRFALLAAAGSLAEARAALARHVPTVLITDLRLPDGHGTDLIRETRQATPATEILVISVLGDERSVVTAIRAGAAGYLLKDGTPEELVGAVHDLLAGHSPISAAIARYLIRRIQGPHEPEEEKPQLTPREIEILYGIAKGFTYNDIAEQLGLSPHTIPTHIKNIYRKLEVHSRSEAVFAALSHRLIRLGE